MSQHGIEFTSISLRNFLSFGNNTTVIPLNQIGSTLITGENLDNTGNGILSNGCGKAQPLYSKIKTPNGWTTMGEIQLNDIISTPDGSTAKVVGIYPQDGLRPIYRVTLLDGRHTDVDIDHLWSIYSDSWDGNKIMSTKELMDMMQHKPTPYTKYYIQRIVPPNDVDENVDIDPYIVGLLMCDELFENIQYIKSGTNIKNKITINDEIKQFLCNNQLNTCNNVSKFIPTKYINKCSTNQKIKLLRGIFDHCGKINPIKGFIYPTVSENLAINIRDIIRSIGGMASITTHLLQDKETTEHLVFIDYQHPEQLVEGISQSTGIFNDKLQIQSIDYIGTDFTQCIMIDHPDHLYITDDYIVTHNTTILNGLVYALYDKPVSNISKDNLVNNINKKNMEVTVEFKIQNNHYKIKRERKTKAGAAGNNTYVWINGVDKTKAGQVNNQIADIIGIPYELFVRIVVFSASMPSFLDLPVKHTTAPNQTAFIEELFGVTLLTTKANNLKELIKQTESDLKLNKTKTELLESEHQRYDQQLVNLKSRLNGWNKKREEDIQLISTKLQNITITSDDIVKLKQDRELLDSNVKQINDIINKFKILSNSLQSFITRQKNNEKIINQRNKELDELNKNICPYCKQEFNDTQQKISNINQEIKKLMDENILIEEDILNTETLIQELVDEKAPLDVIVDSLKNTPSLISILEMEKEPHTLQNKLIELQNAINPYDELYQEQLQIELPAIDYTKMNELTDELEHQKFLLKLLTKKDSFVRKAILNKNIPYLNTRLQQYLVFLGLPHKVEFNHDMSSSISQFGRTLDVGNLSAGQKSRMELALSLAFRDVLQSIHTTMNVWILDEVLDVGLDTTGIQLAAKLIKQKAKDEQLALYVISHREEVYGMFDNSMVIQMQKGFSYIKP